MKNLIILINKFMNEMNKFILKIIMFEWININWYLNEMKILIILLNKFLNEMKKFILIIIIE